MCKARKYINDVDNLISNLNSDIRELNNKRSEYDKLVSEYYHKIEQANFNACEGYYLAKQLQEILRKRRVIKEECERLLMLKNTFKQSQIENKIHLTKNNIKKLENKSCQWKHDWKYTYTLEEVLN